jgi:hypothetical protein
MPNWFTFYCEATAYYRIAWHGNLNGLAWYFGILDGNDVDELSCQHRPVLPVFPNWPTVYVLLCSSEQT